MEKTELLSKMELLSKVEDIFHKEVEKGNLVEAKLNAITGILHLLRWIIYDIDDHEG